MPPASCGLVGGDARVEPLGEALVFAAQRANGFEEFRRGFVDRARGARGAEGTAVQPAARDARERRRERPPGSHRVRSRLCLFLRSHS